MSSDNKEAPPEYQVEVQEQVNIQDLHAPIMREQAEPRDGFEPIPPFFAPLFGVLVFWAGFYFATHFRDFSPNALSQDPAPVVTEGPEKELTTVEKGAKIFAGTCAGCHGGDGAGGSCPPLAGSEWVQQRPAGVIIRILLNGAEGPIQVKGKDYNLSMKLPDPLSDADAAAVATFVRQAWGNKASKPGEVTPDFVKTVRNDIKPRTSQFTASELMEVKDDLPSGANVPPAEVKDKPTEKK